jgi:Rieske Fe-S protein
VEDRIHRPVSPPPASGCRDCINRRDFLASSALAAAALAALEACGDGQIGPPTGLDIRPSGSVTIRLADFPGLATTGVLVGVDLQRAVVRTGPSSFAAFSRICTHQQCLTDIRNNQFECPCHGSRFAKDGSVINGPNIPGSVSPLAKLAVTVNADNTLTLS